MYALGQQLRKSSCSDYGYIVRIKIALLQIADALFSIRLIILLIHVMLTDVFLGPVQTRFRPDDRSIGAFIYSFIHLLIYFLVWEAAVGKTNGLFTYKPWVWHCLLPPDPST